MGACPQYDPDVERSLYWDRFESVPPATVLLMMRLYWDESETAVASPTAVMTMAGWAIRDHDIKPFAPAWQAVLKHRYFRVGEARATDLLAREGDFKGWTDNRGDAFQFALSSVIAKYVVFGVACSVVLADYHRVIAEILPPRTTYRKAYVWLMQACLDFMVDWNRLKKRDRFLVIPDDGIPKLGKVKRSFLELVNDTRGHIGGSGRIIPDFTPRESFQVSGLQAADMLASGIRLGTMDRVAGLTGDETIVHGVVNVKQPILGGYYTEAEMRRSLEPYRLGLVKANDIRPLQPKDVPISAAKKRRKGL